MDEAFFASQRQAVFDAYAGLTLVGPEAFESGQITFAARDNSHEWYETLVLTAPEGTIVSAALDLLAAARDHAPKHHYEASQPWYLQRIAEAARALGRSPSVFAPNVCWALRTVPPRPAVDGGLRFETWERDRVLEEMASRRFENGLGEVGVMGRDFRNKWAIALVDSAAEPVAVAGVFDTSGLDEIGVDVVRAARGRGLGAVVVAAATLEILERGGTPFYGCAAANIRSQRTALSSGYAPVMTDASVV